jgi:oxygen-dependent protoporphyrinogen oxidase
MSTDIEHIVIGAGISGLGLAHSAVHRGVQTLVLERAQRVGGCMNSRTFPGCGNFWAEAGSHTCFNSYGHLLDILGDLGLMDRLTPKSKVSYSLWREGERKSVFSALHPLELAISLPRLFTNPKQGNRVADYYGHGLGRKNYRDLFGPAFRAVICQVPDEFPAELLFRRKPRRKEVMRSFTFPGGLSDIPAAIAAQKGLEVLTGQDVAGVDRKGDGFRVVFGDGSELECRKLTLAVPPDVCAALLQDNDAELHKLVGTIGVSELESVALCVPAGDLNHLPPLAGLIAVDDAFYSMVSRDYLPDERYRGFTFHFPAGVHTQDEQMESICRALGVEQDRVSGIQRVTNRLPALRTGHRELVQRIDARLAGSRLAITGNWFLGVSIEDCLTRSRQEAKRLFGP